MGNLTEPLSERIQTLLQAQEHQPIRSTTGTRAAIESLAARTEALEATVRELTAVLDSLAPSREPND